MRPLGHQRRSVVQISAVQGSMFQLCASYFISINPRFQWCAIYFTSVNPRLQHYKSFFISANPRFSVLQDLSGFFGHQHYTMVSTVQGNIVQGPIVYIRCNFLWHNYDFWSLRTLKSINWNIPKRSMDLDLSLVVMAKFYSTFSNCFIYLLFSTRRPP